MRSDAPILMVASGYVCGGDFCFEAHTSISRQEHVNIISNVEFPVVWIPTDISYLRKGFCVVAHAFVCIDKPSPVIFHRFPDVVYMILKRSRVTEASLYYFVLPDASLHPFFAFLYYLKIFTTWAGRAVRFQFSVLVCPLYW